MREAAFGAAKDVEHLKSWMQDHQQREEKFHDEVKREIKSIHSDLASIAEKMGTRISSAIADVARINNLWAGGAIVVLVIWGIAKFILPLIMK